jgi:hypothetical protein
MKKVTPVIWCLSAMIFTSCLEEALKDDGPENRQPESLISKTFSATRENYAVSKAAMQDGADFGKVNWERRDQMTILALNDGTVSAYAFSTDEEGPSADFTNIDGVVASSDYYAVFPHMSPDMYLYVKKSAGNAYGHDISSDAALSIAMQSSQPSSAGNR